MGIEGAKAFQNGGSWKDFARGYSEKTLPQVYLPDERQKELMEKNLIPPSDSFIKKLADDRNKEYTVGKEGVERFYADNGDPIWPPNNGNVGLPEVVTLKSGTIILSRYGPTTGFYTSPKGTTIEERAVSRNTDTNDYHEYEVVGDILKVEKGTIAPWFGQVGGGIQYKLPGRIASLLSNNLLKEIK